jgi:hypothetical protein
MAQYLRAVAFAVLTAALFIPSEAGAQKGASCPLTDAQTKKAIAAFQPLATFLSGEPRCFNCHGGVNPFIDGVGLDPEDPNAPPSQFEHGGGKQGHDNPVSKDGSVGLDEGCKDCHSQMLPKSDGTPSTTWTLAPGFMSFVNKDATTLCRQMKRTSGTAEEFLGHLKDDNGRNSLGATAFAGRRALTDRDIKKYEVQVLPPAITHDRLMQMGRNWIDAMGGKFQGDISCGCELKHSKWSGEIHYVIDSKGDAGQNDLQNWANRELITFTIIVSDGVGTARGHAEMSAVAENRQKMATGGYKKDTSSRLQGTAAGIAPATVEVRINEATGTYEVLTTYSPQPFAGKQTAETCIRDSCNSKELLYSAIPNMGGMQPGGKLEDPDHVSGSRRDVRTNVGRAKNGVFIRSVTWDLWRTASAK